MSNINVTNIDLVNNPSKFTDPFTFQITFECLKDIQDEIEWKIIYVGSSKDEKYDQVLDSFSLGPLEYGIMQFDLETNPPDPNQIPESEILGVTAIIISVTYQEKEFFRVGYYVYNSYDDPEMNENPPEHVQLHRIVRNVLHDKPRITRFDIQNNKTKEETSFSQNEEFLNSTMESSQQNQFLGSSQQNNENDVKNYGSGMFNNNNNNPFLQEQNPFENIKEDFNFENCFGNRMMESEVNNNNNNPLF